MKKFSYNNAYLGQPKYYKTNVSVNDDMHKHLI